MTGWCCGFAAIPANMSSVATGGDWGREREGEGREREREGRGRGRGEGEGEGKGGKKGMRRRDNKITADRQIDK